MRIADVLSPVGVVTETLKVEAYGRRHGRTTAAAHVPPRLQCPCCRFGVTYVQAGVKTAHFRHRDNGPFCPLKESGARPYINLVRSAPDPARGRRQRAEFRANWGHHYIEMSRNDFIPFFSYSEFLSILERAVELQLFDRVDLQQADLPYVLAVLHDYPPETGIPPRKVGAPRRAYWFRFWFENMTNEVDQLWIEEARDQRLMRASFIAPQRRGAYPDFDRDLMAIKEMVRRPAPLPTPRQVADGIVKAVTRWFDPQLSFPRP